MVYEGKRGKNGVTVTVDGEPLAPRRDLRNHSPNGFEWGYGGSGPSQLALGILAHHLGDAEAFRLYQDFKRRVVAGLPESGWTLTSAELEAHVEALRAGA